MAFQVRPASYSDLDTLADVMVSAHVKDELVTKMMGDVAHQEHVKWYADAFRKVWEEETWARYFKVVEEKSSKIVAMARFHYPHKMTAEEKARGERSPYGPLPEGANTELCQEFFEKLEHCEAEHLNPENTYFVHFLATLPEYHRNGLGRKLMNVCLNVSDEARAETFLIATPAGSGLYRKLGFEEIDSLSWDTEAHGGDGKVTWLCMMRKPNTLQRV